MLKEVMLSYERGITSISRVLNNIGLWVIVGMVLLTVATVIGRRFFNAPIIGAKEIQQFCLLTVAFFTWGYCQAQRGNIVITFISDFIPKRVMTFIDIITNTAATVLYGVLGWRLLVQAMHMRRVGWLTPELRIPEWPFLGILGTIGISVFVLVMVLTVAQHVAEAVKK